MWRSVSILMTAGLVAMAAKADAQTGQRLDGSVLGTWDASAAACDGTDTSLSRVLIAADKIDTYGGDATVVEVERIGQVTFVAGDFLQVEGAEELGDRSREYFRLTQSGGADRLQFIWKGVQTLELQRCGEQPQTQG